MLIMLADTLSRAFENNTSIVYSFEEKLNKIEVQLCSVIENAKKYSKNPHF